MASMHRASALRQINRLFDEGTLAGLPDARLLERYATDRDELAFESLVKRHGAMVRAVCLGVVDDPNDADDAFQAAFLLLAAQSRATVGQRLAGRLAASRGMADCDPVEIRRCATANAGTASPRPCRQRV